MLPLGAQEHLLQPAVSQERSDGWGRLYAWSSLPEDQYKSQNNSLSAWKDCPAGMPQYVSPTSKGAFCCSDSASLGTLFVF